MAEKYSESAKRAIFNGILVSKDFGHSYFGSEHLLLGILSDDGSFFVEELNKRGVYYKIIKKRIISISGSLGDPFREQKEWCKGCTCPKDFPICVCGNTPKAKMTPSKAIEPSAQEQEENPRSKSAKLRILEKI